MITYDNKTGKYIITLDDGTSYSIDGSALGANEISITTPEVNVKADAPRNYLGARLDREYASEYRPNDAGEYATALMNMPFAVADMPFQAVLGEKATPFQSTMGAIGAGLSPTRWIGTGRSFLRGDGFVSPWNENNPGLTGNPYNDDVFDLLTGPKFEKTSLKSATLPYRIIRNATVDRPKIAYYNLAPGNYSDFMKRAGGFAKDIITGKTYTGDEVPYWRTDAPAIKGEAFGEALMREYFPEFKKGTERYNKVKQYIEEVRDDAWRMRTFGEQQYDSYVLNSDGTYSINMDKRYAAFGKDYTPNVVFTEPGESVSVPDRVTSSAGNTNQKVHILGRDGNTRFGVQELTDTWDAHPFVRGAGWGDAATRLDILADKYVYGAVRNKANKLYNKLYYPLYHWDKPWGNFAYNNLGGEFLNKLRNKSYKEMPFNKQITNLANKAANWEIKDFVGGYEPFTWHQEFPFTEVMRLRDDGVNGLKVGKVIEPGFNSTNVLPSEVFDYMRTGIKPSDMKFDYSNFINNIDINDLINKTYDTNTRRKANKLYNKLYYPLYHWDKPWGNFAYNNLGGEFLNKLRNKSYKEMPFNKQITNLANKAANWEIKDFVGGYEPFTWHQEFPFTEVMRLRDDGVNGLKVGKVIEPGFNSTNVLPSEVFDYMRTGIKPSDMKFDYSNFINNIDINDLINKTYDTNTRRKANK